MHPVTNEQLTSLIGKRITLVQMDNDPNPIPKDSQGEVYHVSGINTVMCQVCVKWDSGRTLNLCHPEDIFTINP